MKYILFLLTISLLFVGSINAQDTDEIKDPKAKAVLDKISRKTENYSSLQLKFIYKIINNQTQQTENHNGYAFLQDDKYKLIIPGVEIISDGKSVWTYQKEVMEVSVNIADKEDESVFNPAKLYTIYKRGFKYQHQGDYTRNGLQIAIIDLFPEKPAKKNFTRVRIEADTQKDRIVSFTTFGKDGIDYVIEFTEFKPDIKIPEGFFSFKPEKYPEDVEVIDLR